MPLGTTAFWGVVLPSEKTNYSDNPSFEYGTAGAGAIQGAALGSASDQQAYGAWSLFFTPTSNGTSGAFLGTVQARSGTDFTASAYVMGSAGVDYFLTVTDTSNALIGSTPFTGGGTWQRYSVGYTENSNTTRRVAVRKANGANAASLGTVYVDGWQFEVGSITTYIDGWQDGCTWNGAPHQSSSFRSGQSRSGGSVVALVDLGMAPDDQLGVGMAPIENSWQSYAIIDGAQYQRTRSRERPFTLTSYLPGASLQDLHRLRRQVINTFKIDLVDEQQPVRFWYTGAGGTVQLDAYLDGGMEGNQYNGFEETVGVKFIAPDPFWESTTQQGTALAPFVNLGSVNFMARRNRYGGWGTMGANGTTLVDGGGGAAPVAVRSFCINSGGTLMIGGQFGSLGGTLSPNLGLYFPESNTFGTFTGGTVPPGAAGANVVLSVIQNAGGTTFFAGQFTSVAGTSTNHVARHFNGAFGTLIGGTVSSTNYLRTITVNATGTMFLGGDFTSVAGTATRNLALWNGANFGTLGGTVNSDVTTLAIGGDGRLFFGGAFTLVNGTAGTAMGQWLGSGRMGTLQNPIFYNTINQIGQVWQIALAPDARLYEAGIFDTTANGSARGAMVWNGVAQSGLGSGLLISGIYSGTQVATYAVYPDGSTGNIYYGGAFTNVNGVNVPSQYAIWNGATWILPDISFINSGFNVGTVYAITKSPQGDLYIGGTFSGTAQAAAVGTIVNDGMANAYPTFRIRNTGASGTARIYQLLNTTTNDNLYFNLYLQPGEEAVLNLQPGARSFQTSIQGNVFGKIIPGSNLATWRLLPGTNYVSFFTDNSNVQTSMYWQPRHWSADAGTTF